MEFQNDAQRGCYLRVREYVLSLYGEENVFESDTYPYFGLSEGSANAVVTVLPWGDDQSVVGIRSTVVRGAPPSEGLFRYLLERNAEMAFGSFSFDSDGDVSLSSDVMGHMIDKDYVRRQVNYVLFTADEEDDVIVRRFGGRRASDD